MFLLSFPFIRKYTVIKQSSHKKKQILTFSDGFVAVQR